MIKKLKKAFTITELVIVIAVIAILAAVLIPTLSSVISSSKETSDKAYVKEINTTLSSYINTQLNGAYPTTYTELMEALNSEGLCDASNPYLLAKELETEDACVIWYPETASVILVLPDDGYTITYTTSSTIGGSLGNAVQVTSEGGTVSYALKLCTSSTSAEKAVAELYNAYYNTYSGSASAFISSSAYATLLSSVSSSDTTWAAVIKSTLTNVSVGYTYSSVVANEITTQAKAGTEDIKLDYTEETLLAGAGYTYNSSTETYYDSTGTAVSDIATVTSQIVSQNVLTSLATMVTLAADTASSEALSGKTITLEVDEGTIVDMSDATITPIGTSYRKDSDFKTSTTETFSVDFGGLTLSGYNISSGTFTSTGAQYQDAGDLGNTDGGYAFTYGILGSVNGSTTASSPTTYSNLTITDINIDLNGSTESIDGTTYSTLCDMAGVVCGFTYGYVNFENITVNGASSSSSKGSFSGYDGVGGIVGRCYNNQTTKTGGVTMTNCSVSNMTITGQRRACGLIGYCYVSNGLTLDGCSVSNVNIVCSRNDGETGVYGGVIGTVCNDEIVIKNKLSISNVSTIVQYYASTSSSATTPEQNLLYVAYAEQKFILVQVPGGSNIATITLNDKDASIDVTYNGTTYSWAFDESNTSNNTWKTGGSTNVTYTLTAE